MGTSPAAPRIPCSQHCYPRGPVPHGEPAELQCPALGRGRHVAAPVLRPLATLVEGAGPGCERGEETLSTRGTPRPQTNLPICTAVS